MITALIYSVRNAGLLFASTNNTMKTKLTLETDYKINGNSTGSALDTLAIAVDGRDSNDIDENMFEAEDAAIGYVLEHYAYESAMLKAATKKQLKTWNDDVDAYNVALSVFTDKLRRDSQPYYESTTELAKELQEAVNNVHDENYKEWLYGDYRNWAGILVMAERKYLVSFETDKGEVYADITDEVMKEWRDGLMEGEAPIRTRRDAKEYLENEINDDARAAYNKRMSENAARKAERERLAAYKAEQAARAEVERKATIKKLIDSK
jgi:hypothetical protein